MLAQKNFRFFGKNDIILSKQSMLLKSPFEAWPGKKLAMLRKTGLKIIIFSFYLSLVYKIYANPQIVFFPGQASHIFFLSLSSSASSQKNQKATLSLSITSGTGGIIQMGTGNTFAGSIRQVLPISHDLANLACVWQYYVLSIQVCFAKFLLSQCNLADEFDIHTWLIFCKYQFNRFKNLVNHNG